MRKFYLGLAAWCLLALGLILGTGRLIELVRPAVNNRPSFEIIVDQGAR